MKLFCFQAATLVLGLTFAGLAARADDAKPDTKADANAAPRIALLGDSITDGLTYQMLLEQAITEAGKPKPALLNAGIGGDTAAGMSDRLETDVLSRRPTMVFLSAGINDSNKVEPKDFRKSVTSIITRLQAQNIGVTLLLPSMVRPPDFSKVDRAKLTPKELEEFEEDEAETPVQLGRQQAFRIIMRQLATQYTLPVADVPGEMQKAYAQGTDLWERDGTHLNFEGYRAFVRAVLDAMNLQAVPVPAQAKIAPAPGLFTAWQVSARPDGTPRLDDKTVAEVDFKTGWQKLKLPLTKPQDGWYWESARQRGVAIGLDKEFNGKNFLSLTTFRVKEPKTVYFSTGAGLSSLWLKKEGKEGGAWQQLWKHPGGAVGWHPSPRAKIDLTPGEYSLLVESGSQFLVTMTPDDAL